MLNLSIETNRIKESLNANWLVFSAKHFVYNGFNEHTECVQSNFDITYAGNIST